MLKGLRLRLTVVYALAALLLAVLTGVTAYWLLARHLRATVDLALENKVASMFIELHQPLPDDLKTAVFNWQVRINQSTLRQEHREQDANDDHYLTQSNFDSELAAVVGVLLDADGTPLPGSTPLLPSNPASARAARQAGKDWRTSSIAGQTSRFFSYAVALGDKWVVLQAVRPLADQERVLTELMIGLLGLSALTVPSVGLASWWLAGRALLPAQQAWNRQQVFVANASHELRTPLTLMRATAEVLQNRPSADDVQVAYLTDIVGEIDHMAALVNDLLLLSRLDASQLQLQPAALDLSSLFKTLEREVARVAMQSDVQLLVSKLPADLPLLWVDPTRLRQVLLIVIDNAIRHTAAGGWVEWTATVLPHKLQIGIHDNGSGIAPEHLPHIFERFYRANEDRQAFHTGSGLGLAIAKGLVDAMQGQIEINSVLAQGTTVTITLPVAR
jgi:signal transduction histidine kinase